MIIFMISFRYPALSFDNKIGSSDFTQIVPSDMILLFHIKLCDNFNGSENAELL